MNGAFATTFFESLGACLLGQAEAYRHMGRRFRSGGATLEVGDVLVGATLLLGPLLLILLYFFVQRVRVKSQQASPRALFFELCQAHELEWRTRWKLWRLARRLQISPPARLFVDPAPWERLSSGAPAQGLDREEIVRLRDLLGIAGNSANHG